VGRVAASPLALLLGAAAAVALASCGGGSNAKLLSGSTANEITANLDRVKQMVNDGDCVAAEDATQLVATQVDELGGVDEKLKQALREGAARLGEVVSECIEETTEAVEPSEPATEAETAKPAKKEKKPKAEEEPKEEETKPATTPPPLPPQAKGEAKGHEPSGGEEELAPPSGGVGPGSPAGEGN
jgi:outer membrane biosynthesis protein TonB